MSKIKWPVRADVQALRGRTAMSMRQASETLGREAMLEAAINAATFEDLKEVVVAMLARRQ